MVRSADRPFVDKIRAMVLRIFLAAFVLLGFVYLKVCSEANFHVVSPGEVYRSGQMSAEKLTAVFREKGVRTVINLRGEHVGETWYDDEVRSAKAKGVTVLSYAISARSELSSEQLRTISSLIRTAPKPVLIHCAGGADRTGLACALYCADMGLSTEAVRSQLSLRYGHFPFLLWEEARAMDLSLDRYLRLTREASPASAP